MIQWPVGGATIQCAECRWSDGSWLDIIISSPPQSSTIQRGMAGGSQEPSTPTERPTTTTLAHHHLNWVIITAAGNDRFGDGFAFRLLTAHLASRGPRNISVETIA